MSNITSACCLALASTLGDKVAFPSSTQYDSSLGSYFAYQEAALKPLCIVLPASTEDVSIAVKTLTSVSSEDGTTADAKAACQFAIRSGGHSSNEGAANIQDGITIDLSNLNSIDLGVDQSTVSVGVGTSWDVVYSQLDVLNLTVVGARAAGVGVGGLSLGGGISYVGTRYGWTGDTIVNYEVVLANGSVVSANESQNPDLLWALRGGGNNFGIVTRVDLQTFEQEPFWGGRLRLSPSLWAEQASRFETLTAADTYDEYAHLALTWIYSDTAGQAISYLVQYTKSPVVEDPELFKPVIEWALTSSLGVRNSSGFASGLGGSQEPNIDRKFWATSTLVSSAEAVRITYEHFNATVGDLQDVENISYFLSLEPLPPALYARHAASNPLGLQDRNQSLIILFLAASYSNEADVLKVEQAGKAMLAGIEEDARKLNLFDPYVYLNYAASHQDPIASYGEENVERLRSIAKAVDPEGVFRTQVPGGFKIPQ
ncbi:oxidoreductase [Diaporthe helianthi]|uniref:Oxidoreductase n=1 Tax=Diaporthe helianthi TaxID=158607 RepID=A0A2P5I3B4_DIAHE|nr:oxidoreductase [Diaporthe helianthi]